MNPLEKALFGIRTIGPGNTLRTLLYTLRRDRQDRRYASTNAPAAPTAPGELLSSQAVPGGADFTFRRAALALRFLDEDFLFAGWNGAQMLPSYGVIRPGWPVLPVDLQQDSGGWRLSSAALQVRVGPNGGLELSGADGRRLSAFDPPHFLGQGWSLRSPLSPEACVYGLGERMAGLNLRPGAYRLWNSDAGGSYGPGADPLYINIPACLCLDQAGCTLAFFDNTFAGTVTLDEQAAVVGFEGGPLRFYLAAGSPAQVLERYTALTGRAPLPPRWALGYQQSRWGYRSEDELRQVFAQFQRYNLPLGALVLDIDHMPGYRTLTLDEQRFPDLQGFAALLAQHDVHLVTIVDPGVKVDPGFDLYQDGLRQDAFCKQPDGKTQQGVVWPGWAAFPDFTSPTGRAWWGRQYARLLQHGVSGFWHDMNEPSSFTAAGEMTLPRSTRHALEGRGGDHREAHNVYGQLMNEAGRSGLLALRPDRRPFILSRAGWAGMQRSAWSWTGDVESTWQALQRTIPQVLGLGLSGQPYCGPDIGGFSGHPSAELFVRWFQAAAFMPFFRTHCVSFLPNREPWAWGETVLDILRAQMELRRALLPYWYTLCWQAGQTGAPLLRPLFWEQPEAQDLWRVEDAFMVGDSLLAAPVVRPGGVRRPLALPAGLWYDFYTGAPVTGGGDVQLEAPLERIPLLLKSGSILPTEDHGRLTLTVTCPLPGQTGSGLLYSDAGDGFGPHRLDTFQLAPSPCGGWQLDWSSQGQYPWPYDGVEVKLVGFNANSVEADGRRLELAASRAAAGVFNRLVIP